MNRIKKKIRVKNRKQNHFNLICKDTEEVNQNFRKETWHKSIKAITKKFQPYLNCIQSATEDNITDTNEIAARWKDHCKELQHTAIIQTYIYKKAQAILHEHIHCKRTTTSVQKWNMPYGTQNLKNHWTRHDSS